MREIYHHKKQLNTYLELISKTDKIGTYYVLDEDFNRVFTTAGMRENNPYHKKAICMLENIETLEQLAYSLGYYFNPYANFIDRPIGSYTMPKKETSSEVLSPLFKEMWSEFILRDKG